MKPILTNERLFQYFLVLILFLIVVLGCEEPRPHAVTIPDIDNEPPTFALTIIGPGIGSKTIRSDSRCRVTDGIFPVLWDTIFVQLPAGVEYNFTLTSYDDGGVFRTFIQTLDSTKLDITQLNQEEAVLTITSGLPQKTYYLYTVPGDPRRSMAITGKLMAMGTGRVEMVVGAFDIGGASRRSNFDAGVLPILYAPGYRSGVFYEGECP